MTWSGGPESASWLRRLWAWTLDTLLFWVPALAGLASFAFHPSGLGTVLAGAGLFLTALYAVCWTALLAHGRTPGKLLAGLRVVHQDGGPVGWRLMLVREVAVKLLVSGALSGITGDGPTSSGWLGIGGAHDPARQGSAIQKDKFFSTQSTSRRGRGISNPTGARKWLRPRPSPRSNRQSQPPAERPRR